MDSLWETYGDKFVSPSSPSTPKVNFYGDISSDDSVVEFSKEKIVRDSKFDKALLKFYMSNKVKKLKRKLAASRTVQFKKQKAKSNEQVVFTRYSGKYFSSVVDSLTPHQIDVIQKYGAGSFLKFEKTDVPLRFAKWIAGKFDTRTSEIQLPNNFIPFTKGTIHNILDLPIGGLEVIPDREAGRTFIMSHFNLPSIPQVSYFGSKLKSGKDLSNEDIIICFMAVMFQSFLCPNSSLQPSSEYLHLFRDPEIFMKYDISKFVYDWLVVSVKNFRKATKHAARRQITLGGNHYSLAVAYLDSVNFGLKSLPDTVPRLLVWKGNKIREYAELDKCSGNSFGKRPLKHMSYSRKVKQKKLKCSQHEVTKKSFKVQNLGEVFINKLSVMFKPVLTIEQVEKISEIINVSCVDKPAEFQPWCEAVVCDLLGFLYGKVKNEQPGFVGPSNFCSEPLFDSPSLKISPHENDMKSNNEQDFDFSISKGKLASGKYQQFAKRFDDVSQLKDQPMFAFDSGKKESSLRTPVRPIINVDSKELLADPKLKDYVMDIGIGSSFQSPIEPVRLEDRFSVQKTNETCKGVTDSNKLGRSNVPASENRLFLLQKRPIVDLTSPVCSKSEVFLISDSPEVAAAASDVDITGHINFQDKCNSLSKQASEAYNKLVFFSRQDQNKTSGLFKKSDPDVQEVIEISQASQERQGDICTQVRPSAQCIEDSIPGTSSSNGFFVPRRPILPGRFNSDPYVSIQASKFPLLPSERRHYSAMCFIGNHNEWKKLEAVKYEKAYCSFESLATLQPYGHVDNYLVLVYCRKLFMDQHPKFSKKHSFFSYVGETILEYNGKNGDIVQTAFEGANLAYPMWRSNQLSFPLCVGGHWFVFNVCFKAKMFAFCDSLYDSNSNYHRQIDNVLMQNFVHLWNILVTPKMHYQINFNEFQVVYPHVPRQTNPDDCGVFAVKCLDVWHPRAQLQNIFTSNDIFNLRIKLANEIYFSIHNSMDKTVVFEFFGDVGM